MSCRAAFCCFFFFNDTATTEIYTLSLHDALPICVRAHGHRLALPRRPRQLGPQHLGNVDLDHDLPLEVLARVEVQDRKSTRLNSSHANISYAVFCLKKKKTNKRDTNRMTKMLSNL